MTPSAQAVLRKASQKMSPSIMHGEILAFESCLCDPAGFFHDHLAIIHLFCASGVMGPAGEVPVQTRQQGGFLHVACSPHMSQHHVSSSDGGRGEQSVNATAWAVDTALRSIGTGQTAELWLSRNLGLYEMLMVLHSILSSRPLMR